MLRTSIYIEYLSCSAPRRFCVFLAQRHQLLGQSLRFLCLVPCCRYGFVLEQGSDEISKERLSMR
jgi:hypothetical protein